MEEGKKEGRRKGREEDLFIPTKAAEVRVQ